MASNGYQTSLLPLFDPDEPLDERVVLLGDPRWQDCLRELSEARWICIDTEFYGPNGPWRMKGDIDYWKSSIRLIQAGLPSGRCLVFNFGGILDDRERMLRAHWAGLQVLKRVVEDRTVPKVGMALLTEYMLMRIHLGWRMRCTRDIMLISQVVWAGVGTKKGYFGKHGFVTTKKLQHSMKAIAERLGIPVDKEQQVSDWAGRLTNKQLNYAARDVVVPWLCFQKLGAIVKADGLLNSVLAECSAQPAFAECEYNGLPIDMAIARRNLAKWEQVRDGFWQLFRETFPGVNPGSPEQVSVALTEAMDVRQCGTCGQNVDPLESASKHWPTCMEGRPCACGAPIGNFHRRELRVFYTVGANGRKNPTTADDVLAPYERTVPYVRALLEGRSTNTCLKWLAAAVEHAFVGPEGGGPRIRTDYRQIAGGYQEHGKTDGSAGRGMGRSASGDPINLQNSGQHQPSHAAAGAPPIRECIRPMEDEFFLVADLSQAHMRIAAQASQDPVMMRDFNAGIDAHLAMSHRLLLQDAQTDEERALTFDDAVKVYKSKQGPIFKKLKALRSKGAKTCNYASLNMSGIDTLIRTASTMPEPVFLTRDESSKLLTTWRGLYNVLYSFQKRRIADANRYRIRFDSIGVDGEYGVAFALTGRRFYMVKEWKPPHPEYGGSGKWSVKGTDCVSSCWMMTEADAIKYSMGKLVDDFDEHDPYFHPEVAGTADDWSVRWCNMAHDEVNLTGRKPAGPAVAGQVQKRFHEGMRWAGVTDLPVDEANADPAKMLVGSWADK